MRKALLAITVVAALATAACAAPKTPAGGYPTGYQDGACVALTGTAACDYAAMIACLDSTGDDRVGAYPCAWIPARDTGKPGRIVVLMDHSCPIMVWPADATCREVTPVDRRTP